MVHRPSDSRLLVNLLSHEKDYAKQLDALLDFSHASLASFSAYASSSAPPTSQIIIQVAGTLAAADDALRKYAESLRQWQDQLKALKRLEDDVANIIRDREILVTRLIKASKQKSSQGLMASSSSSTLSTPKARPEVPLPAKLATAQSELQACEAHLATKERELAAMRTAAVRRGLSIRCAALTECGQTWAAMGTEALQALGTLDVDEPMTNGYGNGHQYQRPGLENGNGNAEPSSDLSSSLGPSQSASQNNHPPFADISPALPLPPLPEAPAPASSVTHRNSNSYTASMSIPPAHAISDHTSSFPYPDFSTYGRDSSGGGTGGSSSSEAEEGAYEVRENTRFTSHKKTVEPVANTSSRHVHFPFMSSAPSSPNPDGKSKERTRRNSVLGSIAAFFHSSPSHNRNKGASPDLSPPPSPSFGRKGGWHTRTDRNLQRVGRDDSDDERYLYRNRIVMPPSVIDAAPVTPNGQRSGTIKSGTTTGTQRQHRLKKRATADGAKAEERGWTSEGDGVGPGVVRSNSKATSSGVGSVKKKAKGQAQKAEEKEKSPLPTPVQSQFPLASAMPAQGAAKLDTRPSEPLAPAGKEKERKGKAAKLQKGKETSPEKAPQNVIPSPTLSPQDIFIGKKPTGTMLPASLPTEASISRNSSMSKHSHAFSLPTSVAGIASQPNPTMHLAQAHRRTTSIDSGTLAKDGRKPGAQGHARTHSHGHRGHVETSVSLMSVVEGVTKDQRQRDDPNSKLVFARAPPPVSQTVDLDAEVAAREHEDEVKLEAVGMTRDASERSVPLTPSIPPPTEPIKHVPSPRLKPLRSALRNPSRSPSPNANIVSLPSPPVPVRSKLRPSPSEPPPLELPPSDTVSISTATELPSEYQTARSSLSDDSSISSYETTRENLEDEIATLPSPSPPVTSPSISPPAVSSPLPPAPPPKLVTTNGLTRDFGGSELSQSTSTVSNTSTQPARRKSVRMSLPPTFSTTPPAFEDDTDGDGHHAPWASQRSQPEYYQKPARVDGWSSRIKEPAERDIWQDTSDEDDEEYSRAKRLLSRASKKKKTKR